AGADRGHVGAGVGLGDRKRADVLAGNELRQEASLLSGVAMQTELVDTEVRWRPIGASDRRGGAQESLHADPGFVGARPGPPPSPPAVTPCTPSLPSAGQRSRGKLLLRSISSARGAMCAAAKLRTLSRSMSAVSPRPKLNPPRPPASMGDGLLFESGPRGIW